MRFNVTDTAQTVPVVYTGILPDLFKEGKGVVAQGQLGAGRHVSRDARCWRSTTRTTCRRKPRAMRVEEGAEERDKCDRTNAAQALKAR